MEHEGDSRRFSRADRRFRRHAREQIGVSAQPLPFTGIQAAPVEEQQHTGWKIGMPDLLHGIQGFGQHEIFKNISPVATREERRAQLLNMKEEFGCNTLRPGHYPNHPLLYDLCDELGFLVFSEIPAWQVSTYYMESPYCSPAAAQWLIDRGARAVGFDCFSEYCARLPDFTSEDFIIHKVILENGALLMQQMTHLSKLPTGRRFQFFAPFIKIENAEGSPVRFFAVLD